MFDSTLTSTRLRYCGIASCSTGPMRYQKTPWSLREWLEVLQVSTDMTCGSLQLTTAHSLWQNVLLYWKLVLWYQPCCIPSLHSAWHARREQTLMPTAQLNLCYKHSSQYNIIRYQSVIFWVFCRFSIFSWCSMIQRFPFSGVSTLRFADWCLIWPVVSGLLQLVQCTTPAKIL